MDMDFDRLGRFDGEDREPLHALEWAGLVARLGAERDLRRELTVRVTAPRASGSFAPAVWPLGENAHGAPSINPEALANGKADRGITAVAGAQAPVPDTGARGQE